jgi:GNAT superfamily N-acetyltransferase
MLNLSPELASRIELAEAESTAAYASAAAAIGPESGACSLRIGSGVAAYAGPGSPVSRAIGLGMGGPVDQAQLAAAEEFFGVRGAPVRVDLCPFADPSLGRLLGGRGYSVHGFKQVLGMKLGSGDIGEETAAEEQPVRVTETDKAAPGASGVCVSVAGPSQGELWAHTVSQGFAEAEDPGEADLRIARPALRQELVTPLLAWAGGERAGGGVVEVRAGIAMLRSQSTRPAFRRRGVQAAVVRASLAIATAAGCSLAVVQAEPGTTSERNLERLGFRVLYTKPTLVATAPSMTVQCAENTSG